MNLPTVLTQKEVSKLLGNMKGKHALMAKLLYGCGLRLMECVRLRIKDVDFGQGRIFIRNTKGGKDRTAILPDSIQQELQEQIDYVVALHKEDMREGFGEVKRSRVRKNHASSCYGIGTNDKEEGFRSGSKYLFLLI